MSGEFPPLNARQVTQVLTAAGFVCIRSAGSHFAWRSPTRGAGNTVTVAKIAAGSVYAPNTLRSIINQSGLSRREFYALLK